MPEACADKERNEIDVYVGNKIKYRRLMLNKSQEDLARSVGLTFQQIQKYEKGTNRVSVSRLVSISAALAAPLTYFLDKGLLDAAKEPDLETVSEAQMTTDVLALIRAYGRIEDERMRKQVLEMTKALSRK